MNTSVLIVTFNSADVIEQCLTSFLPIANDVELVVVDNNSKNKTVIIIKQLAEKYKDLRIRLIQNNSNIGFANAGELIGQNWMPMIYGRRMYLKHQ